MSPISCILYPPTHDYNYMVQRPHQLMKEFSKLEIPCYWENHPFIKRPPKGIQQINPNFFLFNDVDPRPFLARLKPVVYFILPEHINIVNRYKPSLVVFDTVDEPSEEFSHLSRGYYKALRKSDLVLATSEKLFNIARQVNPHSHLVPNGCDYNYFVRAACRSLTVPEDIKNIPGPVIGYLGAVASWCDLQLVDRLALEFPHCSIVMVGPLYNINQIPLRANLYWLGIKPYEEVASYVQSFDVGIIPFRVSSMIESVNPIKMWEYLAAGIPVVTTALPEAQNYQSEVLYSPNADQFINNVSKALNNDSHENRAMRLALARRNSWTARARQVVNLMEQRLSQKGLNPTADQGLSRPFQDVQPGLKVQPGQNVVLGGNPSASGPIAAHINSGMPSAPNLPRKTTISQSGFTYTVTRRP